MTSKPIYVYDIASQFITPLAVVWDEKFVTPIISVVLAGCEDRAYVTSVRLHGSDTDPLKAPPKTKAFSSKRFLRRLKERGTHVVEAWDKGRARVCYC